MARSKISHVRLNKPEKSNLKSIEKIVRKKIELKGERLRVRQKLPIIVQTRDFGVRLIASRLLEQPAYEHP